MTPKRAEENVVDFEDKLVSYPFPLRKHLLASLYLPIDLTPKEAKSLSKYIESLAV
jgi:hypothetical protein